MTNVSVDFTTDVCAVDPLGLGFVITEFGGNPVPVVASSTWRNTLAALAPGHCRCSLAWYGGNPGYGAGGGPGEQGSGGSTAIALVNAIKSMGAVPLVSFNGDTSDNDFVPADGASLVSFFNGGGAPSWDPGGAYDLIFDDEFTGTSLDTTKWNPSWFGSGSGTVISGPINSAETAKYSSANVSVSGGYLNLELTNSSSDGGAHPDTGAVVSSNPHDGRASGGFEFTYGSVEWRAYLPPNAGDTEIANWPALWLDGQSWPADGEFDVVEGLSGTAQWHIPTNGNIGGPGSPQALTGWHQFGVQWLADGSVTFYYDGTAVSSGVTAPNTSPMYLIMDNTQGSSGGPGTFPSTMLVDWVKVWQPGSSGGGVTYWSIGNEPDSNGVVAAYEASSGTGSAPATLAAMKAASPGIVVGIPAAGYWDTGLISWAAGVSGIGALSYHAYDGGNTDGTGFPTDPQLYQHVHSDLPGYKSGILYGVEEMNWHDGYSGQAAFTNWENTCFIADNCGQALSGGGHATVYGDSNGFLGLLNDGTSGMLGSYGTPTPAYYGLGIWTGMNGQFKRYSGHMVSASTTFAQGVLTVFACDNGKIVVVNKTTAAQPLTIGLTLAGGATSGTYNVWATQFSNPTGAIQETVTGASFSGRTITYTVPGGTAVSIDVTPAASVPSGAALSAPGRIEASANFLQHGIAAFSAGAVLRVAGTATSLSAAPRLSAYGRVIKNARAALSAPAAMNAGGFVPAFSAAPSLTAAPLVTGHGSAALRAAAVLTAATSSSAAHLGAAPVLLAPGRAGSAALAAGTVLGASGSYFTPGSASLAAAASLGAAAKATVEARAALAAQAALEAAPYSQPSSAHLSAGAVLTAGVLAAAAHLSAGASLAAAARRTTGGTAALHAPGTAGAAARRTAVARAALHAQAAVAPHAVAVRHAAAALPAAPVLGAAARRLAEGIAHLGAASSLAAQGRRTAAGHAALAAGAALTAAGTDRPAARLAGNALLHGTATAGRAAHASLRAPGALTPRWAGISFGGSAMRAGAVLEAVPLGVILAPVSMTASCSLAADPDTRPGFPFPLLPPRPQPAWQRDVQRFAVTQERQRHAQALWQYGELAVFCLLWRPEDIGAGLARRCTRCYLPSSVIPENPPQADSGTAAEALISGAYGQGSQYRCPLCYGTQLIAAAPAGVPGVRALLVRPAILTDTDQNQQRTAKGTVNPGSVAVQSTPDFRVSTLDYCFRSDGRRYQLSVPARTTLRTGFGSPWQQAAAVSYNLSNASLEDPRGSVAYIIPPTNAVLARALGTYTRIPADYAWLEQVNGPLIPEEAPPPAASGQYQPSASLGT